MTLKEFEDINSDIIWRSSKLALILVCSCNCICPVLWCTNIFSLCIWSILLELSEDGEDVNNNIYEVHKMLFFILGKPRPEESPAFTVLFNTGIPGKPEIDIDLVPCIRFKGWPRVARKLKPHWIRKDKAEQAMTEYHVVTKTCAEGEYYKHACKTKFHWISLKIQHAPFHTHRYIRPCHYFAIILLFYKDL